MDHPMHALFLDLELNKMIDLMTGSSQEDKVSRKNLRRHLKQQEIAVDFIVESTVEVFFKNVSRVIKREDLLIMFQKLLKPLD